MGVAGEGQLRGSHAARWIIAAMVMPAWLLLCWLMRPARGVADRPQRLAAGEAAEVMEVAQQDVDRLEPERLGDVLEPGHAHVRAHLQAGRPADLGHRRLAAHGVLVVFERQLAEAPCRSGPPSRLVQRPLGSIRSRAVAAEPRGHRLHRLAARRRARARPPLSLKTRKPQRFAEALGHARPSPRACGPRPSRRARGRPGRARRTRCGSARTSGGRRRSGRTGTPRTRPSRAPGRRAARRAAGPSPGRRRRGRPARSPRSTPGAERQQLAGERRDRRRRSRPTITSRRLLQRLGRPPGRPTVSPMPTIPASVSSSTMLRRKYGPWQPLAARRGGQRDRRDLQPGDPQRRPTPLWHVGTGGTETAEGEGRRGRPRGERSVIASPSRMNVTDGVRGPILSRRGDDGQGKPPGRSIWAGPFVAEAAGVLFINLRLWWCQK